MGPILRRLGQQMGNVHGPLPWLYPRLRPALQRTRRSLSTPVLVLRSRFLPSRAQR